MKITKVLLNIILILSLRFGLQHKLIMEFPENVKLGRKYRKLGLTDYGQYHHNWR